MSVTEVSNSDKDMDMTGLSDENFDGDSSVGTIDHMNAENFAETLVGGDDGMATDEDDDVSVSTSLSFCFQDTLPAPQSRPCFALFEVISALTPPPLPTTLLPPSPPPLPTIGFLEGDVSGGYPHNCAVACRGVTALFEEEDQHSNVVLHQHDDENLEDVFQSTTESLATSRSWASSVAKVFLDEGREDREDDKAGGEKSAFNMREFRQDLHDENPHLVSLQREEIEHKSDKEEAGVPQPLFGTESEIWQEQGDGGDGGEKTEGDGEGAANMMVAITEPQAFWQGPRCPKISSTTATSLSDVPMTRASMTTTREVATNETMTTFMSAPCTRKQSSAPTTLRPRRPKLSARQKSAPAAAAVVLPAISGSGTLSESRHSGSRSPRSMATSRTPASLSSRKSAAVAENKRRKRTVTRANSNSKNRNSGTQESPRSAMVHDECRDEHSTTKRSPVISRQELRRFLIAPPLSLSPPSSGANLGITTDDKQQEDHENEEQPHRHAPPSVHEHSRAKSLSPMAFVAQNLPIPEINLPSVHCEISRHDYLTGRGGHVLRHPGNRRVRELILKLLPKYSKSNASRAKKASIVDRVIQNVKAHGGTFLTKEECSGNWIECTDLECRRKVSQRFREEASGRPNARRGGGGATSEDWGGELLAVQ